MKILVIRFSSIGDIVLTTPVVRCLKKQLGAEVHYVTKSSFGGILRSNPYVDKVWTIDKDVSEIAADLRAERFDYVVDLHKNARSLRLKWALRAPTLSFNKLNVEKWLLVNLKIDRMPNVHIVDRYLETVASLGVVNDGAGLDYFIPEKDAVDLATLGVPPQYVAFVIGAAHATKRLPAEKIAAICDDIRLPIVLLGGKDDVANAQSIAAKTRANVIDLCGKLNLNQSASVVRQATKVVTHDTGLMHIAAAFKKDVVSVWGNTVPAFGMTPYRVPNATIIEVEGLSCRPCSKIGHDKCPKGHFNCMTMIDNARVAAAVNA